MHVDVHVREATKADLPAVRRIQLGSAEAAQWDVSQYPLLVAECEGSVTGFLAWRTTAPDEAEILNLAVASAYRRRGVAQSLLRALDFPNVFLEVRESNTAARALYKKAGFAEAGIRFGYYAHPTESGVVMRLDGMVRIPIADVFDLHSVPPRDVEGVTEAYLEEAYRLGLRALRIIHGRGIGVQRETVRRVLARTAFVSQFRDAPPEAGGWGATLVTLIDTLNENRETPT